MDTPQTDFGSILSEFDLAWLFVVFVPFAFASGLPEFCKICSLSSDDCPDQCEERCVEGNKPCPTLLFGYK